MKSDDAVGSSDINLLRKDVDASPVKFNFKTFRADVDMVAPVFKLGMVFADVEELRKAINAYSVRERRHLR
jgi:hypothetical protein